MQSEFGARSRKEGCYQANKMGFPSVDDHFWVRLGQAGRAELEGLENRTFGSMPAHDI